MKEYKKTAKQKLEVQWLVDGERKFKRGEASKFWQKFSANLSLKILL